MSVSPLHRWNDDRLDDLQRRVASMEPTVGSVGELRVEMRGLARDLETTSKGVERLSGQLEAAQREPVTRMRNFRSQAIIAISAAVVGGGMAILGTFIGGAH